MARETPGIVTWCGGLTLVKSQSLDSRGRKTFQFSLLLFFSGREVQSFASNVELIALLSPPKSQLKALKPPSKNEHEAMKL